MGFYPPPVTGRSVSFRLRFRSVRVVPAARVGEAKLRRRITIVFLTAGPFGCEYPGGLLSAFSLSFCCNFNRLKGFLLFFEGSSWFFVVMCMVLRPYPSSQFLFTGT